MSRYQTGSNIGTIMSKRIDQLLREMETNPASVRFTDLLRVCEYFFGSPRQAQGSHVIFKMPWPGDPRVNIQNVRGRAKPYQVRQVLIAVGKLKDQEHGKQ